MTFTELIAEIKWEAKLEQDSTWDAHLLLLIWDELVQIASLQSDASLYVSQLTLSSADQDGVTGLITLPALVKVDLVEYLEFSSNTVWILPDRDDIVPPIPFPSKPKSRQIVQGTPPLYNMSIQPLLALGSDLILFSYWKIPPVPTGGTDIFPNTLIQPLKTNCIRRALIFNASSADKQAEMFSQILAKAEAVTDSSNKTLDETKPS